MWPVVLLSASGAFHLLNAGMWFTDDQLGTSDGCGGEGDACINPLFLITHITALGLGTAGAARLAAWRGARAWRSPLFWAGMAVAVGGLVIALSLDSDDGRTAPNTVAVGSAVAGTALHVAGAWLASPVRSEPSASSAALVPACGPTRHRGFLCQLALTGW